MVIPSRQVHFDFHTSELINDIGSRFTKENFREAIRLGNINSMTVFAKCHHGWCYYDTKIGKMHPGLSFDLLKEQITVLHEEGAKAPIYITVGWSALDADSHEDWLCVDFDTKTYSGFNYDYDHALTPDRSKPYVSWKNLCINGKYGDHVLDHINELCDNYEVDGFFLDIMLSTRNCVCSECVNQMTAQGFDPDLREDSERYFVLARRDFMRQCVALIKSKKPDASVFFNGVADIYTPEYHEFNTHFELEDLPTTWGGYDKMPMRAKFFARTGKDYVGLTGKFHTSWGEFGGFKNPDALKYEAASMLTYGARCNIGDQLHPLGELDLETYRITGHAFSYVKQIEDHCFDIHETTRLGVVISNDHEADEGITKILLETMNDFDIVIESDDLRRFDVIVLPDRVTLTPIMVQKLKAFIACGGGVVISGCSAVHEGKFQLDLDLEYLGKSEYDNDYIQCGVRIDSNIIRSPFLAYDSAHRVRSANGEVLAKIKEPYFSRTYEHYCSHQNTPNKPEDADYPAAVKTGRVVYIAHEICKIYFNYGCQYHRDYFVNAMRLVYTSPVMRIRNMPSAGRCRFVYQYKRNRYILHLLYASPIQRNKVAVLEDFPTITNIVCDLRIDCKVLSAKLIPQSTSLDFVQSESVSHLGPVITVTIPEVRLHQMVVFEVES